MAGDLNSAMGALRGLLGDNADEKLQSVMQSLTGNAEQNAGQNTEQNNENINLGDMSRLMDDDNMQYVMKMKGIIDEMSHSNDPRSNLLLSLKPYMRNNRQSSIDNIIKLMSLTKFSGLFNFNKGNK